MSTLSLLQVDNISPYSGTTVTSTGTIVAPAATTALAPLRIPHGTAPTSPTNGDVWTTTSGIFARVNGISLNLKEALTPEDYGAVGDGATDDLTPLTNWLNAVMASNYRIGVMANKTYAISGALPDITTRVMIYGAFDTNHDVGSIGGTVIKAITNTGFTMLTIAPTEGASAQFLTGVKLIGITLDGNSKAAKCLVTKSIRNGEIEVHCKEATTTGWEMGVSTTLGENTSAQRNIVRYYGRQTSNAAVSLRLIGSATGNPSLNIFEYVDIIHKNEIGIIEENADNNIWIDCRVYRAAGGSATNSIEWRGGASEGVSCRAEHFYKLSSTVAAIAKGTGTYTVGAKSITIDYLDLENATPAVTVETGAAAWDGQWITTTPTPTPTGGAFTATAVVKTKRDFLNPKVRGVVTITNVGTGTGNVNVTLPYKNSAGAQAVSVFSTFVTTTGIVGGGAVNVDDNALYMCEYDGTTPIAVQSIQFSGSLHTDVNTVLL